MTWQDARYYCRQHSSDLVSVLSLTLNEDLTRMLQVNEVGAAWIGLYRESWKWADGSRVPFTLWAPQQPNNENGFQACVYMQGGTWNDWNCDTEYNFLCEGEPKPSCYNAKLDFTKVFHYQLNLRLA